MAAIQDETLPADPVERRRIQNRIAQRKFRQRRSLKRKLNAAGLDPDSIWAAALDFDQSQSRVSDPWFLANDQDLGLTAASLPEDPECTLPLGDAAEFLDPVLYSSSVQDLTDDAAQQAASADAPFPDSAARPPSLATDESNASGSADLTNIGTEGQFNPIIDRSLDEIHAKFGRGSVELPSRGAQFLSSPEDSASGSDNWLTALHIAADRGRGRVLEILLQRGAFGVNERDGHGKTALHHAVIGRHLDCMKTLLKYGAKPDLGDFLTGWNSMHWAAIGKDEDMLSLLVDEGLQQEGFDIDAYDSSGWTTLHCCVERGFEFGVEFLLQKGANLSYKALRCKYTGLVIPRDIEALRREELRRISKEDTSDGSSRKTNVTSC